MLQKVWTNKVDLVDVLRRPAERIPTVKEDSKNVIYVGHPIEYC